MRTTLRYISVVAAAFAVLLSAETSRGSSESAIQVAQPMVIEEGIFVSAATYSRYVGLVPGYAVSLVSAPNCIVGEDGTTQNRNAANIAGIIFSYDPFHNSGHLRGDTLCVRIDLSGLHPAPELRGWSLDAVVDATIGSLLLTASWHRFGWNRDRKVEAKFVRVDIAGSQAYGDRGGTFGFKSLGELPRRRHFH